jgi:hypothetical protein
VRRELMNKGRKERHGERGKVRRKRKLTMQDLRLSQQ